MLTEILGILTVPSSVLLLEFGDLLQRLHGSAFEVALLAIRSVIGGRA